jgi:hypothetical protein
MDFKNIIIVFSLVSIVYIVYVILNEPKTMNNKNGFKPEHRLVQLLNKISSADKVILKNVKERWSLHRNLVEPELKQRVNDLIRKILSGINGISEEEFFVKDIENLYVMKDDYGNFRCIVNTFIYDVHNYHTIKIVFDVTSIHDTEYINMIDVDQSALNNVLNRYDVRWKSQGILTKYNMFDEDVEKLLDNYYSGNFKVIPMSNDDLTPDVSGTFNINQLTTMYLPANIPSKDSPMFCKNKKFEWDSKSIPISTDEDCVMDQSSIQKYPNTPYNAPGVVTQRVDNNNFSWMRERTNLSVFD